jgi:hypothetical protein
LSIESGWHDCKAGWHVGRFKRIWWKRSTYRCTACGKELEIITPRRLRKVLRAVARKGKVGGE